MKTHHTPLAHALAVACLIFSVTFLQAQNNDLTVKDLRIEYLNNPVGIDEMAPRFFWKLDTERHNTNQTAYQLRVSLNTEFPNTSEAIWDTGEIPSSQSIQIVYQGPELQSKTLYYWQVRVWDNHGRVSPWSETAFWEMGLLSQHEWVAKWIEPAWEEDHSKPQPSPMFRKEFQLNKQIASARAYVSSLGLYELHINGKRIGDQVFTPGWTSFNNRVQYQTYDITNMLTNGENAIGIMLGDGWYRGFIGWGTQRNYYGTSLAFIARLDVTYTDGSKEVLLTDESWKGSTGPIVYSDIYKGEYYDARLEKQGWTRPGYQDQDWRFAKIVETPPSGKLIAPQGPAIRKIQELYPIDVVVTPQGDTVFDLGQNLVGWIRLQVSGPRGTKITLRHAETLDKDGNFYTENLRSADQVNHYILRGEGVEIWEPRFSFQGFRYVAISGYPGELKPEAITGVVIHSDMEPTGHFDCSHALVNQLQHNIIWGQKGNFLDVPTDCPQRDERMGWTGDIQVFARTANINMNTTAFLTKWLGDVTADQFESGSVPHVIPNVLGPTAGGAAGWGDASTVVPHTLYDYFGDERILDRQYESMKAWVEYAKGRAARLGDPHLWTGDFHFGDWLSFSANHSDYPGAYTTTDMIATAYFARSTYLLARAATILGKTHDAYAYNELFKSIKKAFQNEFVTPNARVISDTQTSLLLSLRYDLLPDAMREKAAEQLLLNVRRRNHLTTGFLGTPHLNHVLSEYGYSEQAYALLLRKSYPSWLYPVTMGATTIWERWDGIKPDGSFQDKGMNSLNHYAYGAIGEWLVKEVAGIKSSSPGYKTINIAPIPGGGLSFARAIQHTLYGTVSSAWNFENNRFILEVSVPANSSAEIILPYASVNLVDVNGSPVNRSIQVKEYRQEGAHVKVLAGSGTYVFAYPSQNFPESSLPAVSEDDISAKDIQAGKKTKIAVLLAYKPSRDILFREAPALMHSPWLSQVMGYSLERAMECLPEELRLSKSAMDLFSD